MLWSKLKNVILAVLLLTNLFLIALVLSETVVGESQELEARATAIAFLAERGIWAEDGVFPRSFTLESQQMDWDRGSEGDLVADFFGAVDVEHLGGEVVRYYNEHGQFWFHGNGEFYGYLTDPVFTVEDMSLAEHGKGKLEALGLAVVFLGETEEFGRSYLHYVQVLEGVPLLGCEIVLGYENGILWEIYQGKRIVGEFEVREEETMTVATALMQFYQALLKMGGDCGEIFQIEESYLVTTAVSSTVQLTPVWWIRAEGGEYYLNVVTGQLEERTLG